MEERTYRPVDVWRLIDGGVSRVRSRKVNEEDWLCMWGGNGLSLFQFQHEKQFEGDAGYLLYECREKMGNRKSMDGASSSDRSILTPL